MYEKENGVIQNIAKKVLAEVNKKLDSKLDVKEKTGPMDVASTIDFLADKLIIKELSKSFKNDVIVTEESSPELFSKLLKGEKGWVIDPICGSENVVRRIKFFSTNIALVESGSVKAAWVVDHALGRVIWSVGQGVFVGDKKIERPKIKLDRCKVIDVDKGYFSQLDPKTRNNFANLSKDILLSENTNFRELSSSLAFAYVATGQIDSAIVINVKPWDLIASCFLVEQSGGIATNFDGSKWDIKSKSAVLSAEKNIHKIILNLIEKNGLRGIK